MTHQEFGLVLSRHYESLRAYAIRLTQDEMNADDLVQETILKAFHYKTYFETGSNLKSWLFTILKNLFINQYRRDKRHKLFKAHVLTNSDEASVFNYNLNIKEIYKEIQQLADTLKIPFVMSTEGYKYEEIANELSLPIGTVKVRIHLARKALKNRLAIYSDGINN